ncbi:hypothetical protein SDC9_136158 [bioreactor metagenome]|uniref:Uncharacterized protein n=1 Tax=bioreactor metagenome TaxID=1076179 RepID=A0A645DHU2_9ZZZZ
MIAKVVVELLFIRAVLLEPEPELRRMRKGKVVRQIVAENAEAQRIFRRQMFPFGE